MKKTNIIIIAVAVVVVIALALVLVLNGGAKSQLPAIESAEDLTALVDKVYEDVTVEMPGVMTQAIDVTDKDSVNYMTGLENGDNLEYLVVSEPMMSSQAYSLVMAKVKNGVNASEVAKTMKENINTRKWICVTAEQLYATNSGDVVFLVMTRKDLAKNVYDSFKNLAGNVGQEFERVEEAAELPEDMY